jgi:hypothetical protein
MIQEYIRNAPKDVFDSINNHIVGMKEKIELSISDVVCGECDHKFNMPVTMDQASFFGKGS